MGRGTIPLVPETAEDIDQELQLLAIELKRIEAEYNMFFAGRLPTPPRDTRARVSRMVARIDARHFAGYGDRFRFSMLQSRFATFVNLWDRGLRAKEEGRPGPLHTGAHLQPYRSHGCVTAS
jgi:hypothetical protein